MNMSKRKARAPPPAVVKRAATEPPEARGEWKAFFYLSTLRRREENSDKVDDHGFEDDYPIPATEPFDEEADRSKLKRALVRSLRAELKKRGADASGDKAALTERLLPLRAQAAEQAEADRSRDSWWYGESLVGFTPLGQTTESPVSLPSVTFTADGQMGIIHPGRSELDHLEGALRRVSPPTTDGFYIDPWDLFENGLEYFGMDTRPSKRPRPICAYEWRPRGDAAWLPARLEWTEAAESELGTPRCTEHECNIPAAGFALRLQLPAGRAPKQWPEAFEGSQAFDWQFKHAGDGGGGEIILQDPSDSFAETIFLCRTADARKALGMNEYTLLEIGWNVN